MYMTREQKKKWYDIGYAETYENANRRISERIEDDLTPKMMSAWLQKKEYIGEVCFRISTPDPECSVPEAPTINGMFELATYCIINGDFHSKGCAEAIREVFMLTGFVNFLTIE